VNLATAAGVVIGRMESLVIDANNNYEKTITVAGLVEQVKVGGVLAALSLSVVGGVGVLGGSNLQLDPAIGTAFAPQTTVGSVTTAAGINQATAALIPTDRGELLPGPVGAGFVLVNKIGPTYCYLTNGIMPGPT